MTVTTAASKVIFQGNGATSVFTYSFAMPIGTEVVLYTTSAGLQTKLAPGTYAITGEGQPTAGGGVQGGTLTYPLTGSPIPVGSTLTLLRIVPDTQPNNFSNQSGLWPSVVEGSDDNLELQIQQLAEMLSRALLFNPADTGPFPPLPVAALRAGLALLFDSNGNPFAGGFSAATVVISSVMAAFVGAASLSTARNLLGVAQIITPQQFGALQNGTTDDTASIQAAVNFCVANGRALYFPGGPTDYVVSSPITITGALKLSGDYAASTIKTSSPTADIFDISGDDVVILDLVFDSAVTRTGGNYIAIPIAGGDLKIERCIFRNHICGILLGSATISIVDIANCYFYDAVATFGVGIQVLGGFDVSIRHVIMNSANSPQPFAGIQVQNSGDIVIDDCNIIQHQADLVINPASGQQVDSIYASNSFFDTSSAYGVLIEPSGTGAVQRCRFIGCWFSSHALSGVFVINFSGSTPTVAGLEFIDCHAFANGLDGFTFDYGSGFTLIGCQAAGNGGGGVSLAAGISDVTVLGCTLGPSGGFGANNYGIFVASGASDHLIFANNQLQGNTTAALNNGASGSHTIVSPNLTA